MLQPLNISEVDCTSDKELLKELFRGKWRLRVLQELVSRPMRLSGLRRAIPECSKKMLIDTLHGLEASNLIYRVDYSTTIKKVEYHLHQACASDIRRLIRIIDSQKILTT